MDTDMSVHMVGMLVNLILPRHEWPMNNDMQCT